MVALISSESSSPADPAESYRFELPRPLTVAERITLARIAGWIDGNLHHPGCACVTCHGRNGRPGMRHRAREAIKRGCPFTETDADELVVCGACLVCQIEAAILEGKI